MTDKPHIVIIAKGGAGWLGGRQYTINLLRALIAHRGARDNYDISVVVKGTDEIAYYEALGPALRTCATIDGVCESYSLANRARWKLKRSVDGWSNPRVEEMLMRLGATFAYPVSSRKVASADWISDFQYKHYPDKMTAAEIAEREAEFSGIVAAAQHIVLSSASAERDCHAYFPQTVGRTHVLRFRTFAEDAWLKARPEETRHKYHLPDAFALISNWLLPTKNHLYVLKALARVPEAERCAMHMVCTGDIYDYRNPGFYNSFLNRIHELGLAGCVSHLGVIPKFDQIQLLRASTLYLQPSLFEGWNTGVEEAQMLGKPILLSSIPVHREQAPARAVFFDPSDPDALAALLRKRFAQGTPGSWSGDEERAGLAAYSGLQSRYAGDFLEICRAAGGMSTRWAPA